MDDIKGNLDGDAGYVVTGFFTPNYRPVAERLVATLNPLKIPHHFFAVSAAEWYNAILLKPVIVMRARALYPGKTIVLMDVDCMVRGAIDDFMQKFRSCDVAISINVKPRKLPRNVPMQDRVIAAARVTVWRPTEGADRLLAKWVELCKRGGNHEVGDEGFLTRAISQTPHLIFETLPVEYDGHEVTDIGPEAVIVHLTTRDLVPRSMLKRAKRALFEKITGKRYEEWKYGINRLRT